MSALSNIYGEVRDLPLAATVVPPDGGRPYLQYICDACGYIYDEAVGDADSGLAAGTRYEDIPDDWVCPDCGVSGSWGAVNYLGASHCYGCQGQGLKLATDVTEEMAHEAKSRTEAGDLAGYFEQGTLSATAGAPRPASVGRMMIRIIPAAIQ